MDYVYSTTTFLTHHEISKIPTHSTTTTFFHLLKPKWSLIALILLIIISQQRRILTTPQILLQTPITLRVHITSSTYQTKQYRKKNQRVCCRPKDEGDPYAEVVDFEDLSFH